VAQTRKVTPFDDSFLERLLTVGCLEHAIAVSSWRMSVA
jgi:hypothetical protein